MLESEIKRLSDTIERLIATIERQPLGQVIKPETQAEQKQEESVKVETKPEPTTTGYTTDDIKSMALAISRKDRSKQADIKAKLIDHGPKVATDLTGDALQAVGEWLSSLKEEIGA